MRSNSKVLPVFILAFLFLVLSSFNIADAARNCKDKDGDGYFHQDGCGTLQDCNDFNVKTAKSCQFDMVRYF